jgi:hypothetical protein
MGEWAIQASKLICREIIEPRESSSIYYMMMCDEMRKKKGSFLLSTVLDRGGGYKSKSKIHYK